MGQFKMKSQIFVPGRDVIWDGVWDIPKFTNGMGWDEKFFNFGMGWDENQLWDGMG